MSGTGGSAYCRKERAATETVAAYSAASLSEINVVFGLSFPDGRPAFHFHMR